MKLQLTKYPKLNFVILKSVEITLFCLIPFWVGKLANWVYVQTNWKVFVPCGNTIPFIWLDGIATIIIFAAAMALTGIILLCAYIISKKNIEWAKKLTKEDKKNETR